MSQNHSNSVKIILKTTGRILKANRLRSGVSVRELSKYITKSSLNELNLFESGLVSPRGHQLYELIMKFRGTLTLEEEMFFCTNPRFYKKVLSREFIQNFMDDELPTFN